MTPPHGSQLPTEPDRARMAVLADYLEEQWPSMDLVAEMLTKHAADILGIQASLCRPVYRRFSSPLLGNRGRNVDRFLNRMLLYPRYAARLAGKFEYLHVADHSYAQLALPLARERVGVFCHDLDTFRCILEPDRDPRPKWFRKMAGRTLRGLQSAKIVFHATQAVRHEIVRFNLVDAHRLVHAPLGYAPEFTPVRGASALDFELPQRFVLNVGSCIRRKRIDILLQMFAAVAPMEPSLSLVQVGGEWTNSDSELLHQCPVGRVMQLRGISRVQLAEVYRRASLVIQPSESEGFGLPVLEAIACGAPVVASDIPVFREVAGDAVTYFPTADAAALSQTVLDLLQGRRASPAVELRLARAARYSWAAHASTVVMAYRSL